VNGKAELRRWLSESSPAAFGLELVRQPLRLKELVAELDRALSSAHAGEATFLLVPLITTDHDGVQSAIDVASAFSSKTRICLALDGPTLARTDSDRLHQREVGLILDNVNALTSVSNLIHQSIEAIKFEARFCESALRELRTACAVRFMADLAGDLGLATLGASEQSVDHSAFDWTNALAPIRIGFEAFA
jgi:hypothetical protein